MTEVSFAGNDQRVSTPCHLALIHRGESEMRETVLAFLRRALDDPKMGIYLCGAPGDAARLLSFLEERSGLNLQDALAERRIILGQGDPDADQQLQNLLEPIRELCQRGFSPVFVVGPAAWNVAGYSAPEDFLWYESRILPGIEDLPVAIMCTYDAATLPGEAIVYGALETHTHTMVNEVVSESPGYIEAERYLRTRLIHLPWLESSGN